MSIAKRTIHQVTMKTSIAFYVLILVLVPPVFSQVTRPLNTQEIHNPTGNVQVDGLVDNGGQVYNVRAYGAKANGTTDDSSAIQSAINAAAPNGTVLLPSGTYKLTTGLKISRGEKFQCTPGGGTILDYTPATGTAITIAYSGNVGAGIYGCVLYGSGKTKDIDAIDIGTSANGAFAPVIENVSIGLQGNSARSFQNPIVINRDNVSADVQNVQIINTIVRNCAIGIHVYAAEQTNIIGGLVAECSSGLKTEQYASDVTITGTSFDTNTQYYIDNEGATAITLNGVHFEDNDVAYTDFIHQGGNYLNSVTMNGGMLLEDRTTGVQQNMVTVACRYCTFNTFGTYLWSRGATIKRAVNLSATGAGGNLMFYNVSPRSFINEFRISNASPQYSHVFDAPLAASGVTGQITTVNQNVYVKGGSVVTDGVFSLGSPKSNTSWSRGTAPPTGRCRTSSLFSNIRGTPGSTLYVCVGGTWVDVK